MQAVGCSIQGTRGFGYRVSGLGFSDTSDRGRGGRVQRPMFTQRVRRRLQISSNTPPPPPAAGPPAPPASSSRRASDDDAPRRGSERLASLPWAAPFLRCRRVSRALIAGQRGEGGHVSCPLGGVLRRVRRGEKRKVVGCVPLASQRFPVTFPCPAEMILKRFLLETLFLTTMRRQGFKGSLGFRVGLHGKRTVVLFDSAVAKC